MSVRWGSFNPSLHALLTEGKIVQTAGQKVTQGQMLSEEDMGRFSREMIGISEPVSSTVSHLTVTALSVVFISLYEVPLVFAQVHFSPLISILYLFTLASFNPAEFSSQKPLLQTPRMPNFAILSKKILVENPLKGFALNSLGEMEWHQIVVLECIYLIISGDEQ